jgi:hypothetical protein
MKNAGDDVVRGATNAVNNSKKISVYSNPTDCLGIIFFKEFFDNIYLNLLFV